MDRKVTPFNTNNAWGFGGGIGHETVYANGCRSRIGTAYFRHGSPQKFENYWGPEGQRLTKEEFERWVNHGRQGSHNNQLNRGGITWAQDGYIITNTHRRESARSVGRDTLLNGWEL